MSAYKGFDKDLRCRGFQYEVGKAYEEKEARICETGFHACENPLNVLLYYPPCYGNRYCEVEQDGEFSDNRDDSKIASTKIEINKEISLTELIQAAIDKSGESGTYSIKDVDRTVAENAKRIEEFCETFKEIWLKMLDWRFGQLALEDDEMLEMLKEVITAYDKYTET